MLTGKNQAKSLITCVQWRDLEKLVTPLKMAEHLTLNILSIKDRRGCWGQ